MLGRASTPKRPRWKTSLLAVEALSSVSGLFGGLALTADPSGRLIGLPLSLLSSLPITVNDFLIPGLWLLVVFGLGFGMVSYLLLSRRPYARAIALLLCFVWLGWITFEILFIGPSLFIGIWCLPQIVALFLLVLTRSGAKSPIGIVET